MNKFLLLTLALSIGLISQAQKRGPLVTKDQKQLSKTATYNPTRINDLGNLEKTGNATVINNAKLEEWEVIGHTWYDYQTNNSMDNRLCTFSDGTMAAVFTYGAEGEDPGFTGRGAGYVYHDGTAWGPAPTERVETERCGWPSLARFGENGEMIVSHYAGATSGVEGLAINTRPNKGTGDWTETVYEHPDDLGASFPKVITNGENNTTIHLLYSFLNEEFQGIEDPIFYNRSLDGGEFWDIEHLMLDGMTAEDYLAIGGDNVVWAQPEGETIAFGVANTWDTDMFIMKSTNNGEDWDKIIVWEHPYPFFDWDATIMTDTMWAPDGGLSIDMDDDGKVHLAASLCRVLHDELGNNYTYWQYGEGILYWNEDRDPFEAENQHDALNAWDEEVLVPDVDLIGWGQDMDGDGEFNLFNDDLFTYRFTIGASTMPTMVCQDGGIVVAWAGISELDVYNDTYNFRRIWTRGSTDNGESWTDHYNINQDITMSFDECIYPVLNKTTDVNFHLTYQADYDIGDAVDGDHDYLDNRITYYTEQVPWVTGVSEKEDQKISISQNYPNPASGATNIHVELPSSGMDVRLEVTNMVGQTIFTIGDKIAHNLQHTFVVDVADFKPGIYFYTVTANEESVTRKMIVE
jgi:hypothetical protein